MVKVIFYIRKGTKIKEYRNFIYSSVVIEAVATAIMKKCKKDKLLQTADSYQCALHKDNIRGIDIYW